MLSLPNDTTEHTIEKSIKIENMWDTVENWRGLTKKESSVDEIDINIKQINEESKKSQKKINLPW